MYLLHYLHLGHLNKSDPISSTTKERSLVLPEMSTLYAGETVVFNLPFCFIYCFVKLMSNLGTF